MHFERKPQGHEQRKELGHLLSLAEITRRYLFGTMDVNEYLALERQLTPYFSEYPVATEAEIESNRQAIINKKLQTTAEEKNDKHRDDGKKA